MIYRQDTGIPLTIAQIDGNFREAEALAKSLPSMFTTGPVGSPPAYKYSNIIGNPSAGAITVTLSGTLRLWPFVPDKSFTSSNLVYFKSQSHSSNNFHFYLYGSDANNFPANRLWNAGTVLSMFYAGKDSTPCVVSFEAGKVYWLGMNCSLSGGALRGIVSRQGYIHWHVEDFMDSLFYGVRIPSVPYGTFPETLTFTNWATNGDTNQWMPAFILE